MSEGIEYLRFKPHARPEPPARETVADWFRRILSEALGPNPLDPIFPADGRYGLR